MKASHLLTANRLGPKHLHLAVQPIVDHQVVGHAYTVRFHGVPLTVMVIPDLGCERPRMDAGIRSARDDENVHVDEWSQ